MSGPFDRSEHPRHPPSGRFTEWSPSISRRFRKVALAWWNVPIVGQRAPFLRSAASSASNHMTNSKARGVPLRQLRGGPSVK